MSRRDLALTLASGTVMVAALATVGALPTLADPRAVAVGVAGGLVVEAAFLAGTRAVEWWERPWVAPASAVVLVVGATVLAVWLGPVVVATACWGLATYLLVLTLWRGLARMGTLE